MATYSILLLSEMQNSENSKKLTQDRKKEFSDS